MLYHNVCPTFSFWWDYSIIYHAEDGIYLAYSDFHPYLLGDSSCMKELNQWFAKQLDTVCRKNCYYYYYYYFALIFANQIICVTCLWQPHIPQFDMTPFFPPPPSSLSTPPQPPVLLRPPPPIQNPNLISHPRQHPPPFSWAPFNPIFIATTPNHTPTT